MQYPGHQEEHQHKLEKKCPLTCGFQSYAQKFNILNVFILQLCLNQYNLTLSFIGKHEVEAFFLPHLLVECRMDRMQYFQLHEL